MASYEIKNRSAKSSNDIEEVIGELKLPSPYILYNSNELSLY